MEIFLIRHGEQFYCKNEQGKKLISGSDAPLIDLGREQMRELRAALDREGIVLNAVYRSPLLRSKQSTDELVGEAPIPIYVVNELKEGFPDSDTNHTYDELEERGGDIYAHPFSEEQESLEYLVQRSRAAIEYILGDSKEHGYNIIGIVGHGDPLCALDWALKHANPPISYAEMRDSYYPQKAQAKEYIINDKNLELESEGRLIITEASQATVEAFRNSPGKEAQ